MPADVREMVLPLRSIEYELASMSFVEFLDHVWIMEPPQAGSITGGGKTKFEKWSHLMEVAEWLQYPWDTPREDLKPEDLKGIGGKSRQVGYSWLFAAYDVWLIRFKEGSTCPVTSQGQEEAKEFISKCQYVYDNLPPSWILPRSDSSLELAIPLMKSRIIGLPSTSKAGRSLTGSFIFMDEADFHEYISTGLLAIKPLIDSGGQIFLCSTVDKLRSDSTFQTVYKNAERDGWKKFFVPYTARPGRDEEWYENTMRSIPEEDLRGMDRELYMEQEYPRSEVEMLSPPKAISYFNMQRTIALQQYVHKPLETNGAINYYRYWALGHKYACGTDTSLGTGNDYSVSVVLDVTEGIIVADIVSNTIKSPELVLFTMKMLESYHNPVWCIENNAYGLSVAESAKEERYPRVFSEDGKNEPGWHTTPKSRWKLWGELKTEWDKGGIKVPNLEGIRQFMDVIASPQTNFRPEARARSNDDYPVAVGLAWQMVLMGKVFGHQEKMLQIPARF